MQGLSLFFQALLMVGFAELGDKTQFLVLGMTAKYKIKQVFLGVLIGVACNSLLAVLLGNVISVLFMEKIPYVKIAAGIIFLVFAVISARDDDAREKSAHFAVLGAVPSVAVAFFVAELGDKTQLSTINMAAVNADWLLIFLGSAAGLLLANLIAIIVGVALGKSIPEIIFKWISVLIFLVFGALTMYPPITQMWGRGASITIIAAALFVAILTICWIVIKDKQKKY